MPIGKMAPKTPTPKKEPPALTSPVEDPVAKAGDYKSIAAQYARAKALKEKEDAAAAKKAALNGQGKRAGAAKGQMTDAEGINKRKEGAFKNSWNWAVGFFVWLL